jgi:hypothetical protein
MYLPLSSEKHATRGAWRRWGGMTFGPFYPRLMRGPVSHAESLSALLYQLEARPGHVAARAWLHGRPEEVECFVRQLAKDFRSKRLSEVAAASALDAYLEALHQGLALHFGECSPRCCQVSTSATAVGGESTDSATATARRASRHFARRVSPPPDEIHADELLAGLPTLLGR